MRSLLILLCFVVAVAFAEEAQRPLGEDPCSWGPAFWCASYANAKRCMLVAYCSSEVWQKPEKPPGSDPCINPGFVCFNYENAQQCKKVAFCSSQYWQTAETQKPLLGRDPCTRGPSFWCKNLQNVKRCMAVAYCNSIGSSFMHMFSP